MKKAKLKGTYRVIPYIQNTFKVTKLWRGTQLSGYQGLRVVVRELL